MSMLGHRQEGLPVDQHPETPRPAIPMVRGDRAQSCGAAILRVVLCWVAGLSGTGKSTIVRELQRSGALAWDADDFSFWRDRQTGEAVESPPSGRPDGWLERYAWVIDPLQVKRCHTDADGRVGYLAGGSENEADVWDLFDTVIYLVADDDTIRRRLTARTENDFGKTEEELAMVLGWNAVLEDRYRTAGATVIDATQSLPLVVEAVRLSAR